MAYQYQIIEALVGWNFVYGLCVRAGLSLDLVAIAVQMLALSLGVAIAVQLSRYRYHDTPSKNVTTKFLLIFTSR